MKKSMRWTKAKGLIKDALSVIAVTSLFYLPYCSSPTESEKINHPPTFISSPKKSVTEGSSYSYPVSAIDQDGDALKFSLTKNPLNFSISSSGVVSGTAPQVSRDTNYPMEIGVSDGKSSATQSYTLTVLDKTQPTLTPTLAPNAHIMQQWESNSVYYQDGEKIRTSVPINYSPNDIIVSGITLSTPAGLLRKVTGVSPDKTILYTEPASLSDIVKNSSLSIKKSLSPSDVKSFVGKKGVSQSGFGFNLNFDGVVMQKDITTSGNFSFDSSFDLDIDIGLWKINRFEFSNITTERAELEINFGNNFNGITLKGVELARYDFAPFTVTLPPAIPVIVFPTIKVFIGYDLFSTTLNKTQATFLQEAQLSLGISRESGTWNSFSDFSMNFDAGISSGVPNNLEVFIGPWIGLSLYGLAGPYASIRGTLDLKSEGYNVSLFGGLEGMVGVHMGPFEKFIPDYSKQVFDYETPLGNSDSDLEGKIVYNTYRGGDWEIASMNANGSGKKLLTNNSVWDINPCFSPDGKKIVYSMKNSNDFDIWVMNSDGSGKTKLTNTSRDETSPSFSAGGEKIIYGAGYQAGSSQIYVMNPDGTSSRNITNDFDHYYWDPSWSPGPEILCYSNRDNSQGEIYSVSPDGSRITRLYCKGRNPSWSPDGKKIVFSTYRDGNEEIYTMNADGSNQINITNSPHTEDEYPSWSPDGNIIYSSKKSGYPDSSKEIWTINLSNFSKKQLTNDNFQDESPFWSK